MEAALISLTNALFSQVPDGKKETPEFKGLLQEFQSIKDELGIKSAPLTPQQPTVTIIVFGRGGSGKSALVNKLVGSTVTMERTGFLPRTNHCQIGHVELNNMTVKVIDTPEFVSFIKSQKLNELQEEIEEMVKKVQGLKLCLFCVDPDQQDEVDEEEMGTISCIFGSQFLDKYLVIVKTKSNLEKNIETSRFNSPLTPVLHADFSNFSQFREKVLDQMKSNPPKNIRFRPKTTFEKEFQKHLLTLDVNFEEAHAKDVLNKEKLHFDGDEEALLSSKREFDAALNYCEMKRQQINSMPKPAGFLELISEDKLVLDISKLILEAYDRDQTKVF